MARVGWLNLPVTWRGWLRPGVIKKSVWNREIRQPSATLPWSRGTRVRLSGGAPAHTVLPTLPTTAPFLSLQQRLPSLQAVSAKRLSGAMDLWNVLHSRGTVGSSHTGSGWTASGTMIHIKGDRKRDGSPLDYWVGYSDNACRGSIQCLR